MARHQDGQDTSVGEDNVQAGNAVFRAVAAVLIS